MNTEDKEIAIQLAKVDKHMRDAMKAVMITMLLILIAMTYFFWFITK